MALTEEQIKLRKSGIGSSDIAAVAGINPYRRPIDVYAEKTGLTDGFGGNWRTEVGNTMEPLIARWYGEHIGATKLIQGETSIHPDNDWIIATPDYHALFTDSLIPERLLEIKCVGGNLSHAWEAGVPDYVKCQVYWQQLVTGIYFSDVAASIGGDEPVVFQVEDSPEIRKSLIEIGRDFWFEHVLKGIPPEVDGSEQYSSFLSAQFKRHSDILVQAPEGASDWIAQRKQAMNEIKDAEVRKQEAENKIKAAIGENAGFIGNGFRVTWKLSTGGGTDWKAVATEMGATETSHGKRIIEMHQRPGSRRLTVTEKKS